MTICILLLAATSAFADPFKCTSAITSHSNGTAVAAGDYVWLNAVLKVNGLGSAPATVFVSHPTTFAANGQPYKLKVRDSQIMFSSMTAVATTKFTRLSREIGHPFGWKTELPSSGLAGNDFLAGLTFVLPAGGLPGGTKGRDLAGDLLKRHFRSLG